MKKKLGKGKTFDASERILQMVSGNVCDSSMMVLLHFLLVLLSFNMNLQEDWTPDQLDDIKKLINDKAITKTVETRHAELQLLESTKYDHVLLLCIFLIC